MSNTRKIALMLGISVMLSLCGCGESSEIPAETTATTEPPVILTTTTATKPQKIIETSAQETPIGAGTENGPEAAAKLYYSKTVFEFISLEDITIREDYVKYYAKLKKNGEMVDPDRYITLAYQDGAWKVVEEGY